MLNELRAFLSYTGSNYPLYFWRTYDGAEVDVLFETRDGFVAIEIKSTKRLGQTLQPRTAAPSRQSRCRSHPMFRSLSR